MVKIPRSSKKKERKNIKCIECNFDAAIDAFLTLRKCPNCQTWLAVDELSGEVKQKIMLSEAQRGTSAGVDDLAPDEDEKAGLILTF
ncbi:MAG: hypothetical protein APR62_01250 [Smithella sp. SDB]|nr:MAG: hypothetical protein APR62_01250 [Smithella sp. SDB]